MSAVTQTSVLMKGLKDLGVTVPIQDGPVAGHPAIFAQGPEAVEGLYVIGAGVLNPSQLPDGYPSKAGDGRLRHSLPGQIQLAAPVCSPGSATTRRTSSLRV